jgi:hypothetical protein
MSGNFSFEKIEQFLEIENCKIVIEMFFESEKYETFN